MTDKRGVHVTVGDGGGPTVGLAPPASQEPADGSSDPTPPTTPEPSPLDERVSAVDEATAYKRYEDPHRDATPIELEDATGTEDIAPDVVFEDPIEALLSEAAEEMPTAVEHIVRRRADGSVITAFKLEFRALPTGRVDALRAEYTKRKRDKRTGEFVTTFNNDAFVAQVVIESCTNLNFLDDRLLKKYKVSDPHKLVSVVLLFGELERCFNTANRLTVSLEEVETEVGNS